MQSWEMRQEKLLNWLRLQWEMSSPGECVPRFWSSFTILLPRNSTGSAAAVGWGRTHGPRSGIPLRAHRGVKGRLEQPGLSSAGSTRKCAALWGEEAKPVLQQINLLYLQPPLWADRSGIIQVANLLLRFCVSFLPCPSSWMSSHWLFPPCSLSFTTINELATQVQRHFGPSLEDLKSVHIPIPHSAGCIWKPKTWGRGTYYGRQLQPLGTQFNMAWMLLALLCQVLRLQFKLSASSVYTRRIKSFICSKR